MSDSVVVYDIRGPRGPAVIEVPLDLAAPLDELRCFWDMEADEGARIGFWGPDGAVAVSFPGWYGADCELARLPEGWMPLAPEAGARWENIDAEDYLATLQAGDSVYIFQSDMVELSARVENVVVAQPTGVLGVLDVEGVEATWHKLPVDTFRAAWAQAQGQAKRIVAGRGGGS